MKGSITASQSSTKHSSTNRGKDKAPKAAAAVSNPPPYASTASASISISSDEEDDVLSDGTSDAGMHHWES
ncbi:hypothetical protein CF319_g6613 [Tilletia indica]|uniref:Uncharacterized protein n=1 Tax=Tilletia indica TaxID=43049 RepID=A0A8T8SZI8_9BASI|nr:hypothetical protein CF319_g6613 [Tilletia indica]KAE8228669.1 hypothetical protein CF326_g6394 [Tilletia indica]KAE8250868.1 hypothetical protein A4X13_0g4304 [Tilletia indica]